MQKAYASTFPEIYRGIVEDNVDPENLGRCKVRVPGVHGDNSSINLLDFLPWAEPIALSPISKERGSINLPDIGDWVWVLFEGARKEYPLYFGGFYSDSDGLGIEGDASRNKVTIYTENYNAIVYDREEHTYTINVLGKIVKVSPTDVMIIAGDKSITVSPKNISIVGDTSIDGDLSVTGDVSINGELTVGKDAHFEKDVHVGNIVYCKRVISSYSSGSTLGLLDSLGYDVEGLSEAQLDELFESLGLDSNDYLNVAEMFLDMEESNDKNNALVQFLGRNLVGDNNAWCALFVSKCLEKAGVNIGLNAESVGTLRNQAIKLGIFTNNQNYVPTAGDIVIMKSSDPNGTSHTGFVQGVNSDGTIQIIAGNSSNKVKSYSINRDALSDLGGFISMGVG